MFTHRFFFIVSGLYWPLLGHGSKSLLFAVWHLLCCLWIVILCFYLPNFPSKHHNSCTSSSNLNTEKKYLESYAGSYYLFIWAEKTFVCLTLKYAIKSWDSERTIQSQTLILNSSVSDSNYFCPRNIMIIIFSILGI